MVKWLDDYTYQCHQCGKDTFIQDPAQWVYKVHRTPNTHYFCSYKCYRQYLKEHPVRKYAKR